jgi:hypothetical protein
MEVQDMPEFKLIKHENNVNLLIKDVCHHTTKLSDELIQDLHERRLKVAAFQQIKTDLFRRAREVVLEPYTTLGGGLSVDDGQRKTFDAAVNAATEKLVSRLMETIYLTADHVYIEAHPSPKSNVDFRHPLDCSPSDYAYEIGRMLNFLSARYMRGEMENIDMLRMANILAALNNAAVNIGGESLAGCGFSAEKKIEQFLDSEDADRYYNQNTVKYW